MRLDRFYTYIAQIAGGGDLETLRAALLVEGGKAESDEDPQLTMAHTSFLLGLVEHRRFSTVIAAEHMQTVLSTTCQYLDSIQMASLHALATACLYKLHKLNHDNKKAGELLLQSGLTLELLADTIFSGHARAWIDSFEEPRSAS